MERETVCCAAMTVSRSLVEIVDSRCIENGLRYTLRWGQKRVSKPGLDHWYNWYTL